MVSVRLLIKHRCGGHDQHRGLRCGHAAATAPAAASATYQPPLMVMAQPEGAWYLRGYIGVGVTSQSHFDFLQNPLNGGNFSSATSSLGDTTFFVRRHRL